MGVPLPIECWREIGSTHLLDAAKSPEARLCDIDIDLERRLLPV